MRDGQTSEHPLFLFSEQKGDEADRTHADELLVHGLLLDRQLEDSARIDQRVAKVMACIAQSESVRLPSRESRTRRWFIGTAVSVAASVLVILAVGGPTRANAAMSSLDRIIAVAGRRLDRTYRIRVVEEYPEEPQNNGEPASANPNQEGQKRGVREEIDQALLHVRGANEFVFIRQLADGNTRVSGCDGHESWTFRNEGPVHVSFDLSRFRGALPGQQQDLSFINFCSQLNQLTRGYEVELQPAAIAGDGGELSKIIAVRKPSALRGPKLVKVWFEPKSGHVHRLLLQGLARNKGGPKSVEFELLNPESVGSADFGVHYFSHQSHHEPHREIRYEDRRK